jgi:hypothetical protein
MSKTCGDMARYNRVRKQNDERRRKVRELREKLGLVPGNETKLLKPAPTKS